MNILIKNIKAILPNNDSFKVEEVSIGIVDKLIKFVGLVPDNFEADKTIDGKEKLAIPGLINGHTHVYMTLFRNCADDYTFNDWLFNTIFPLESKINPEDCYWSTIFGYMEMLRSGTTCCNDMGIFTETSSHLDTDTFAESAVFSAHDVGFRTYYSRGISGGKDDAYWGAKRLKFAVEEYDKYNNYSDLVKVVLAPHAPYTCDNGYMREISSIAKEKNIPIHTHLSESRSEIQTIKERYGCTPTEIMDKCGLLTSSTVAAHCVYLTDSDIQILHDRGVSVATNPVSNLKLANGFAPIPKLLKAGVNITLGTDGAASNNTLNMFKDLSFLTLIHKGISGDPQEVTAVDGFKMATINGAKALGLNAGSIEPGKLADIAILDLTAPNLNPPNNILSSLSYSANGSEVETVIVNGKILMENRHFTTIDEDEVMRHLRSSCKRIGL